MSYDSAMEALGDGTRRAILDMLREGPRHVREIADDLPVSRPAVSKHLRILREAGFVVSASEGTRRIYRLQPDGFAAAIEHWDEFWNRALTHFKEFAETEGGRHA